MTELDPTKFHVTVRNFVSQTVDRDTEEVFAHSWEIMNGGALVFFTHIFLGKELHSKRVAAGYGPGYWLDFNEEKPDDA